MMTDPKSEKTVRDPIADKRRGNARLQELSANASPATVTEVGFRKLFDNWERAGKTIVQARQMLADSIEHEQKCAEEIVRKLGRGQFRYKDTLYVVTANKTTVYLRPLTKRPNHG